MLKPVRHWPTALVGLVLLIPLGLGLVRGSLSIEDAAYRALVMIVVLGVCDHIVVPLASLLVGPPRPEDDEGDAADGRGAAGSATPGDRRAGDPRS